MDGLKPLADFTCNGQDSCLLLKRQEYGLSVARRRATTHADAPSGKRGDPALTLADGPSDLRRNSCFPCLRAMDCSDNAPVLAFGKADRSERTGRMSPRHDGQFSTHGESGNRDSRAYNFGYGSTAPQRPDGGPADLPVQLVARSTVFSNASHCKCSPDDNPGWRNLPWHRGWLVPLRNFSRHETPL